MSEKVQETAFTTHTYRHTTLGFLRDIKDMPNQYEYSRMFFDRFYRPENCVLLVVGDIDPEKTFGLARKYYGGWERGSYRFEVEAEPPQKGEKRADLTWPNPTLPYLYIAYRSPAFSPTEIDMPALDLLSQLLFSDASPLYQKLVVEEQVVDILFGGAGDHRDPKLFDIIARVKDPERVNYVESEIIAALDEAARNLPDAARLDEVKSHLKYGYAMGMNTANNVAGNLAHYIQLTGDPNAVNQVYEIYRNLTPEQVRTITKKYFVASGRTVVTLRYENGGSKGEQ